VTATADIQKAIGARIRDARLAAILAQEELAALLGVGRGTISRRETGTRAAPSAMLPRLAAALNTTVAHLTGAQPGPVSLGATSGAGRSTATALWPTVQANHLHEHERDTIVQIVNSLVAKPELLPAVLGIILQGSLDPSRAPTREKAAAAVLARLRTLDVNQLTPVNALRTLADLQALAVNGGPNP
jgi:transcriptional regulator with XRE-family HTH domain